MFYFVLIHNQQITECAKNLQFKLSLQSSEFIIEEDKVAAKKKHDILDKYVKMSINGHFTSGPDFIKLDNSLQAQILVTFSKFSTENLSLLSSSLHIQIN